MSKGATSYVELVADDAEETEELVDKGKEEATKPEIPEKTFLERVSDLISALQSVDGYEKHPGLINFEQVVEMTNKRKGSDKDALESGIRKVFEKFYLENRKLLLIEDFGFLKRDGCAPFFGSSKKAILPMSEIYSSLYESNPGAIVNIEACIYFMVQHVCPDDDLEKIMEICSEFEPQQNDAPKSIMSFIGNIIGRASEKVGATGAKGLEDENGQIDTKALIKVAGEMFEDGEIGNSMQSLIQSIGKEDIDMNSVLKGLIDMDSFKKGSK